MHRRQALVLLASPILAGCNFGNQQSPEPNDQTATDSQSHTPTGEQKTPLLTGRPSQTPMSETATETPVPATSTPTLTVRQRYAFGEYHREADEFEGGPLEYTIAGFELLKTYQPKEDDRRQPIPGDKQVLRAIAKVRNPLKNETQYLYTRSNPRPFAIIANGEIYEEQFMFPTLDGVTREDLNFNPPRKYSSAGRSVLPGETDTFNIFTVLPETIGRSDVDIAFDGEADDDLLYPIRWN